MTSVVVSQSRTRRIGGDDQDGEGSGGERVEHRGGDCQEEAGHLNRRSLGFRVNGSHVVSRSRLLSI